MSFVKDFISASSSFRNVVSLILAAIVFCTGALESFTNLLAKVFNPPYLNWATYLLMYIGAVIFIWILTGIVINKQIKHTGIPARDPEWVYKKGQRVVAKIVRGLACIGLLAFVYGNFAIRKKIEEDCMHKARYTAILVSRFSKEQDDAFSIKLYNYLRPKLKNDSLIRLDNIQNFIIPTSSEYYNDSLSAFLQCYKAGMLVFGSRNLDQRYFYCRVFMRKMIERKVVDSTGDEIQGITFDIPIDTQCHKVGEYLLSIVQLLKGEKEKSMKRIDSLIAALDMGKDKELISNCYLLKGIYDYNENRLENSACNLELSAKIFPNKAVEPFISSVRNIKQYTASIKLDDGSKMEPGGDYYLSANRGFTIQDSFKVTFSDHSGNILKKMLVPEEYELRSFIFPYEKNKWTGVVLGRKGIYGQTALYADSLSCLFDLLKVKQAAMSVTDPRIAWDVDVMNNP